MNRRELLQTVVLGAGAAAIAKGQLPSNGGGTYNGPPGGSRGTTLVPILAGPFVTASRWNGLRKLTEWPQFAVYLRVQVHPGQHGKIAITNDWNPGEFMAELWPNYDGSTESGRSDVWEIHDVNWQNTINLAALGVQTEIWGETPLVTAYQLV